MTVYTGVDPRVLRELGADVRQLTEPIHVAAARRVVTHPCLLDSLRAAIEPGAAPKSDGARTRRAKKSGMRAPANLDASEALSTIYVELGGWRARLGAPAIPRWIFACAHVTCARGFVDRLPYPPCKRFGARAVDWHKYALRQLVGLAPTVAPSVADWLAMEVDDWWRMAAVQSGWRTSELLRVR